MRIAVERGYAIYPATGESRSQMVRVGIPVAGRLDDLLARVEVDCTPLKIGAHRDDRAVRCH